MFQNHSGARLPLLELLTTLCHHLVQAHLLNGKVVKGVCYGKAAQVQATIRSLKKWSSCGGW